MFVVTANHVNRVNFTTTLSIQQNVDVRNGGVSIDIPPPSVKLNQPFGDGNDLFRCNLRAPSGRTYTLYNNTRHAFALQSIVDYFGRVMNRCVQEQRKPNNRSQFLSISAGLVELKMKLAVIRGDDVLSDTWLWFSAEWTNPKFTVKSIVGTLNVTTDQHTVYLEYYRLHHRIPLRLPRRNPILGDKVKQPQSRLDLVQAKKLYRPTLVYLALR